MVLADTLLNRPLHLTLEPRVVMLDEVKIASDRAVRHRGDTLIISVDSVKTQPHASATDLLNNVPGASVDANGQVRIMGKTVDQVTVDGKTLYGGNAKATLEALNADMIKDLEVMAATGAEGDQKSALNIRLKEDRKAGSYGKVEGLAGTSGTYLATGRVSRLRPGSFLSAFVTTNNVYEQALTSEERNNLVRDVVFKGMQGVYSVTESALPRPTAVQADRTVQNLVEPPLNVGDVVSTNGGLNFNRSGKASEIFGYVLFDRTRQEANRSLLTTRFLPPLEQTEVGRLTDARQRSKLTAYFNAKWTLTPRLTLAVASTNYLYHAQTMLRADFATRLERADTLLTTTALRRLNDQTEQQLYTTQQAVGVYRHKRPAHVSSLYARYGYGTRNLDQRYANHLVRGSQQAEFRNRIDRRAPEQRLELQALHALPISRRVLAEAKGSWLREASPVDQQGYRYDDLGQEIREPGLSLPHFWVENTQQTAQTALYYKTPRFSALGSLALWHWHTHRELDANRQFSLSRTAWLPGLFVEYRPDAVTKLSFRYGQTQALPTTDQLFPLPDSTYLQTIHVGNPLLTSTFRHSSELSLSTDYHSNRLTLTGRYGLDDQPVLTSTQVNSLGFLTQSYQQYRSTSTMGVTLLWYQYHQLKPYSLYGLATAQWLDGYLITQATVIPLRTMVTVLALGTKWRVTPTLSAKLDVRTTLTRQRTSAISANVLNGRSEPTLRLEKKWAGNFYLEGIYAGFVNRYARGGVNVNSLLDLTASKYLGSHDRVKVAITVRNALNVKNLYTNSFSNYVQREESVTRLPRFLMLGISVFPEKWQ
ncbi:TonB-dependent receptor [Hymenobacter sp. NST-14]|uniref:outer membrane beta-barrel protein n=1 Tax=Hymenobacter piscis TaxID=2839984 RepID=UPI001C02FFFE|nr:outer membrane beta-barrel protein [Hymenobacter piscis]MBT9395150.1 TonB-dependent receptor [Hymenobacter piscis]